MDPDGSAREEIERALADLRRLALVWGERRGAARGRRSRARGRSGTLRTGSHRPQHQPAHRPLPEPAPGAVRRAGPGAAGLPQSARQAAVGPAARQCGQRRPPGVRGQRQHAGGMAVGQGPAGGRRSQRRRPAPGGCHPDAPGALRTPRGAAAAASGQAGRRADRRCGSGGGDARPAVHPVGRGVARQARSGRGPAAAQRRRLPARRRRALPAPSADPRPDRPRGRRRPRRRADRPGPRGRRLAGVPHRRPLARPAGAAPLGRAGSGVAVQLVARGTGLRRRSRGPDAVR